MNENRSFDDWSVECINVYFFRVKKYYLHNYGRYLLEVVEIFVSCTGCPENHET